MGVNQSKIELAEKIQDLKPQVSQISSRKNVPNFGPNSKAEFILSLNPAVIKELCKGNPNLDSQYAHALDVANAGSEAVINGRSVNNTPVSVMDNAISELSKSFNLYSERNIKLKNLQNFTERTIESTSDYTVAKNFYEIHSGYCSVFGYGKFTEADNIARLVRNEQTSTPEQAKKMRDALNEMNNLIKTELPPNL